jgi:type VI protein secretion system component VasF
MTMTEPTEPQSPTPTPDERAAKRYRDGRGVDTGAIVWGAILLAVGAWFFLDQTLGIDLPAIDWGDIWPIILIVVGAVVIFQGMRRRTG